MILNPQHWLLRTLDAASIGVPRNGKEMIKKADLPAVSGQRTNGAATSEKGRPFCGSHSQPERNIGQAVGEEASSGDDIPGWNLGLVQQ